MPKMPRQKSSLQQFLDEFTATGRPPLVASSVDEIRKCDFVVCVLASAQVPLPDNVFDFCCECGEEVQLRPHVPKGPKRICYACARKLDPELGRPMISQRTADEIKVRKRRN